MTDITPLGINEEELSLAIELDHDSPSRVEREYKFQEVLRIVLPHLGTNEGKIILAQVMIALKLEGLIGKDLSGTDSKMVKAIHESIMVEPQKKKEALRYAQRLIQGATDAGN